MHWYTLVGRCNHKWCHCKHDDCNNSKQLVQKDKFSYNTASTALRSWKLHIYYLFHEILFVTLRTNTCLNAVLCFICLLCKCCNTVCMDLKIHLVLVIPFSSIVPILAGDLTSSAHVFNSSQNILTYWIFLGCHHPAHYLGRIWSPPYIFSTLWPWFWWNKPWLLTMVEHLWAHCSSVISTNHPFGKYGSSTGKYTY